ncbi:hypothetical protein [Ensifer adhaerens]|uniref:hypothetical protein n=1 Tax=Ensifer adhaerens TaxID=106592 RepID=UPI00117733F7|nr:hypothetical protein [Ensifer adhaerens]
MQGSAFILKEPSIRLKAFARKACFGMRGLVDLGRARLAMALPRHREQLRSVKDDGLYDLFEKSALAATTLDALQRVAPRREERRCRARNNVPAEINSSRRTCEAMALLGAKHDANPNTRLVFLPGTFRQWIAPMIAPAGSRRGTASLLRRYALMR